MTDRARPGLVALYDIRPGNRAGQFLQPRSPHGAGHTKVSIRHDWRAQSGLALRHLWEMGCLHKNTTTTTVV